MVYEALDRGLFVAIWGFCQVIRNYLYLFGKLVVQPFQNINLSWLTNLYESNRGEEHIVTLFYHVLGIQSPLFYQQLQNNPNWPFWADLRVPRNAKMVGFKFRGSQY